MDNKEERGSVREIDRLKERERERTRILNQILIPCLLIQERTDIVIPSLQYWLQKAMTIVFATR
jgi:hypothetical protein